jgi:sugar phosphate isomerase/epimerase
MPGAFTRLDLEAALNELLAAGDFDGVGLHVGQLGPGVESVAVGERHAEAAGELVRSRGLVVSTLNVTGDFTFDPFGGQEAMERSVAMLAFQLRMAAAMGAPRVMTWDAVTDDVESAPALFAECVERGRKQSGLSEPPPLTVELHPFTFALRHRRVEELGQAMERVGDASFCWDFAHCAIALGAAFLGQLPAGFVDRVGEVHYCDSDGLTSELHVPPGDGLLDLAALEQALAGRAVPLLWDLFSWPAPRDAIRRAWMTYAGAVDRHRASLAPADVR